MRALWKQLRYRFEWLALMLTAKIVPLFSRSVCSALGRLLGALAFMVDARSRRVALSNLESAFGDQISDADRRIIARQSFQQFARTMLELFWSPNLSAQNLSHYVEMENLDEVKALADRGPLIVAVPHYGNWEWLSAACAYKVKPGTIIMQEFKNSLLDPIFRTLREHSGHELIAQERGVLKLYKALRRGGAIALLLDLTLPPREGAVVIDCFGLKTSVTAAHVWLSKQTGAPIVVGHSQPMPDGRYRVVFYPPIFPADQASDREIAQNCWNLVEPAIARDPAPWLWMYKHWRYRPTVTRQRYPDYAQSSPRFDRLIAASDSVAPPQGRSNA